MAVGPKLNPAAEATEAAAEAAEVAGAPEDGESLGPKENPPRLGAELLWVVAPLGSPKLNLEFWPDVALLLLPDPKLNAAEEVGGGTVSDPWDEV